MKNSKYVQIDTNVLLQYTFDDNNLVINNYNVTTNRLDSSVQIYSTSDTTNRLDNTLILLDPVTLKYGKNDEELYSFLKTDSYTVLSPIKNDILTFHFPINWVFDVFFGCYIKVYVLDNNGKQVELSSYFLDKILVDRFTQELELNPQRFFYNGRNWGKFIELQIPSPSVISTQLTAGVPTVNSINYNITSGVGISGSSPIFIEFSYITDKTTLSAVDTYTLSSPIVTSVPQTPEYEILSVKIEPSSDGDWFNIYGQYNNSIADFNTYIQNNINMGRRYSIQYEISVYEQNIKGQTLTFLQDKDFNRPIEFRPILKITSTTAVIEVKMNITDLIDNSLITKSASYGLLMNEVSKYSKSMVRLNINKSATTKIYNLRNGASIFDPLNRGVVNVTNSETNTEVIRVNTPVLVNVSNVVTKSESSIVNNTQFWGYGKLKIMVNPFDNIYKFVIAQQISGAIEYFDLSNYSKIELTFKNYNSEVICNLLENSPELDLVNGTVIFKLSRLQVNSVRAIYQTNINTFYITYKTDNDISAIYQGTFIMSDSVRYVNDIATDFNSANNNAKIRRDNSGETAIVTRQRINTPNVNFDVNNDILGTTDQGLSTD